MPLNLPLFRRLMRRVVTSGEVDVWSRSERQWTLCPPSTAHVAPAIFPPGAIEKIRTLSPWRSWAVEAPLIHGGTLQLGPTRACLLRDVDIVGGHLYCGPAMAAEGLGKPGVWLKPEHRHQTIEHGHLVSTLSGTRFFGCLLLDDFPLSLLAPASDLQLSLVSNPYTHEAQYRALVGLGSKITVARARIRELMHYEDPAFNASKVERYRVLRERLRLGVGAQGGFKSRGVYIRRGLSGERRVLANEPDLESALVRQGFTVLDPTHLSALEIARCCQDAPIVISVEGSQISHAIFSMADDAALVVLQPPDRFGMAYKEFTDGLGMRFAFVVGNAVAEGFTIDMTELLHVLDQLDRATSPEARAIA